MPPSLPTAPSTVYSSSSSSAASTANIRVLVRVRPHNHAELTERGSIGRSNVLTLDSGSKSNQSIDFNNSSQGIETSDKDSSHTISSTIAATITVKGIDDNDWVSNNSSSLTSSSSSSAAAAALNINARRRLTGSSVGYASDGDNGITSSSATFNSKQFTFDAVYGPRSTQSEVYESVKGIVEAVVQGYNGTIVCYGQTGSGKTFTMCGGNGSDEAGLIQRSLRDIFQKITLSQAEEASGHDSNTSMDSSTNISTTATFHGSFFEIFNERVYDLLSNDSTLLDNSSLAVREDAGSVYVEGLKEIQVTNTSEAEELLKKGMANRHVASTKMNRASSRSHAVFVLSIKTENVTSDGLRKVKKSKFTLVDLAGSERQKSTAAYGSRLKEASMINKSLLCLGHVINTLVDKEAGRARHIPFRDSKLTFLLRDTWGGNSKTCLVATVSPSGLALSETISTLKFAQRAKLIKNNAVMNEDTCGTVAALQAEVAKLRSELEKNSSTENAVITEKKRKASVLDVDVDVMSTMRRRAEKAEMKILALEKVVSDEKDVTKTLKRKLQEETMVRKFKERRLDYLQTKHKNINSNDIEHVQLLRDEIASLQRRLDTPSVQSIEWRVAYEQAKEELEKSQKSNDDNNGEFRIKNEELEKTIERLCTEKMDLQERLSQVISSSNDTRTEIDSMINEVDRLENDMNMLQEQLDCEKSKSNEFKTQASEAQTNLMEVRADHSKLIDEKNTLEFDINVMKTKLGTLQREIHELENKVKVKESEIIEVETLSRENELELQCTIEELQNSINESATKLKSCKEVELELHSLLKEKTKLIESTNNDLEQALNKVQNQQSTIAALEEKITNISSEHNEVNMSIKQYKQEVADSNSKIDSMKEEMEQLNEERSNLSKRIICVKEQAKLTEVALSEKTASFDLSQKEIVELKGEHAEKMKSCELEKQELERKVSDLQHSIQQLEKSKCDLESRQEALDEKNMEIKKLKDKILSGEKSQDDLRNSIVEKENQIRVLEDEKSDMSGRILQKESDIHILKKQIQEVGQQSKCSAQELAKSYQGMIDRLESNSKEQLSKMGMIEEQLQSSIKEKELYLFKSKDFEGKMTQLRAQNELLEKEKNNQVDEINGRLAEVKAQLNSTEREKDELERYLIATKSNLQKKESEVAKLSAENRHVNENLTQVRDSLQLSKQEYADKVQQMLSAKQVLETQLLTVNNEMRASCQKQKSLEKEISALKAKLEAGNDQYEKLRTQMDEELKKKDEVAMKEKRDLELLLDKRDRELSAVEKESLAIKTEHSLHLKQHKESTNAVEELKKKIQIQQDRVILLQREKGHLEFELDNLREDQDSLNNEVRTLAKQNKSLLVENEQLQQTIETLRNENLSTTSISLSKESTFTADSNISYDALSTEMDSMLGKISKKEKDDIASDSAIDTAPLEESFDESMFLPNVEEVTPAENIQNKENKGNNIFSTPSKMDYGVKRQPLSEHKVNKTPLLSFKKLKSSSKKIRSSAKKDRSNYMIFNNRKLFGNK